MPEQYIITGTITPADGAERAGVRVRAFDRDLPSLERRTGSAPQMLGEGITDAKGRFQIAYTPEQFSNGEGMSQFRRVREQNADLSFRVFDRAGQEGRNSSIVMQSDEIVLLHFHYREFRFDIAANQIKHDGKRGNNPERIPWFAEIAAHHQWTVPQLVPY